MKFVPVALTALVLCAMQADAGTQDTRQFIDANCQKLTDACTAPIVHALDAAAASGKIAAKCVAGRPPKQLMALDIALWLVGHHDLDAKPIAESAVITAERLWPCSRAN
jgi:hypothetical protein